VLPKADFHLEGRKGGKSMRNIINRDYTIYLASLSLVLLIYISVYSQEKPKSPLDITSYLSTLRITKEDAERMEKQRLIGNKSLMDFTKKEIDSLLSSQLYLDRQRAAYILGNGSVYDTSVALSLLRNAFINEIANPLPNKISEESVLPFTESLKNRYCNAIINLYGKNSNLIGAFADSVTGEFKTRIILAIADLGDSNYKQDVRNIYKNSKDGLLRFEAINVINAHPDTADIPILREAINDEFTLDDFMGYKVFLIRPQAAGALIKLGFEIRVEDSNWIIVKEPNK
jgi:hypothetical protein